ncbi:hypothetical protein CON22_25815, partial [Bacillus cereus]
MKKSKKNTIKKGLYTSVATMAIGSQILTAVPHSAFAAEEQNSKNGVEVQVEAKTDIGKSEENVNTQVKAGLKTEVETDSLKGENETNPEGRAIEAFVQGYLEGELSTYKPSVPGTGHLSLHYEAKALVSVGIAERSYLVIRLPFEFADIAGTPAFKKAISGKIKLPGTLGIPKTYNYTQDDIDVYTDRIVLKNPRSTTALGAKYTADIEIDFGKAIKETDVHIPQAWGGSFYEFKAHLDRNAIIDWEILGDKVGSWHPYNRDAEAPNNKPIIKAEDRIIKEGAVFDPRVGVTAHDAEDGDLTNKIEILSNNVDTTKPGEYTVIYSVTDSDGNKVEKQIKVTVKADEKPVIEAKDRVIKVGDNFDPKEGVTAHDEEDGDLTNKIEIISNNVDTTKRGEYTVVYSVIDSHGNKVEKQIKVTVTSDEKPVIEAKDRVIKVGDNFDPKEGVTAHDEEDGDLTSKIEVIYNNVDTTKPGEYTVAYIVRDSDGHIGDKQIRVTVKSDEKPVIEAKDRVIKVGDNFDPKA